MIRRSFAGFTLLEMLLALSLGAVIMTTISSVVMPLLQSSKTQLNTLRFGNELSQANDFFDTVEAIAGEGIAVFPSALDRNKARSSFAIQFLDTGHDMSEDANGDGSHGIANMDTRGFRLTNSSLDKAEDDDHDGFANEDPQNGIDDDNDGLIDEDPGNDDDDEEAAGVQGYDDNNDNDYDYASRAKFSADSSTWAPFIPNSLFSKKQTENTPYTFYAGNANYKQAEDDNEDGVSNNGPSVTWSVRLENEQLVCTTPIIEHTPILNNNQFLNNLAYLLYEEYICLQNVKVFQVIRQHNRSGDVVLHILLSYELANKIYSHEKRLVFP